MVIQKKINIVRYTIFHWIMLWHAPDIAKDKQIYEDEDQTIIFFTTPKISLYAGVILLVAVDL